MMTKILVVDDDILALATVSMGLEEVGYEVMKANTGAMALQLCQSDKPDLALLDISMPVMSGFDVGKALSVQGIPFIFLTAYSDDEMVQTAASSGAFGYLVKPIEIARIIPAIEVVLLRAEGQSNSKKTIENLNHALEKNREIDIAIGLLMERYQLNRTAAFEHLRSYARTNRLKIIGVAQALVAGELKHIL